MQDSTSFQWIFSCILNLYFTILKVKFDIKFNIMSDERIHFVASIDVSFIVVN